MITIQAVSLDRLNVESSAQSWNQFHPKHLSAVPDDESLIVNHTQGKQGSGHGIKNTTQLFLALLLL